MSSSYNANSAADRERIADYWTEQPSSSDLAAGATVKPKPSGAKDNPFGENSHNSNDPKPKKDGADNTPLKDGSKSPFPHKPSK